MCAEHDIRVLLNICSGRIEYIQCMRGIIITVIDIIVNFSQTISADDEEFIVIQSTHGNISA